MLKILPIKLNHLRFTGLMVFGILTLNHHGYSQKRISSKGNVTIVKHMKIQFDRTKVLALSKRSPVTQEVTVALNDGIRVVAPELTPNRDRVADEIVGVEIDDEFSGGREMREILGFASVKMRIGPLVDVTERARVHCRSKLAHPFVEPVVRIVID